MSNAIPKLLHARMLLVAPGGFLTGYDDKTVNALVAIAIEYDVKLFLSEPNYCGGLFTRLLIPAVQQYPHECGVEDAKSRAVAKEPFTNQHRLIVCPSIIEQDFDSTQVLGGERGPLYRLFYQIACMVRAEGALS
jgi:Terminase Bacteriophage T7, Ribonuclease H-like domain